MNTTSIAYQRDTFRRLCSMQLHRLSKSQSPYQRGTFRHGSVIKTGLICSSLNPLISGAHFDSNYAGLLADEGSQSPYQRGTFRPPEVKDISDTMELSQSPYQRGTFRLPSQNQEITNALVSIPLSAGHISTFYFTERRPTCMKSQSPYQRGTFRRNHRS